MSDEQPASPASEGDAPAADPSSLKGLTMALGIEPAEPGQDPLLGRDIGGVTIVRLMAEGGMGRVYEGLQEKPKRKVAVKVMRPGFISRQASQRFGMELEILGRLRHPFIAQIFSAGMCDVVGSQVPYFVMEYIPDALPLTFYAKQKMLGIKDRLTLFHKVCDAVAHGHEHGIVHRDLKPSNILVEPTGVPKIIDFGIARTVGESPEQETALTELGQLIGTLQYMSPEQIEADPAAIDQRTDVYALGVILYELLTGARPYEISNQQLLEAARIVRDKKPISPLKLNPQLDARIVRVTGKCLQKDRNKRFADAGELAEAIVDSGTKVAPDTGKHRPAEFSWFERSHPWARLNPWVVALGLLVPIIGLAAASFLPNGAVINPPSRFPPEAVSFQGHTYLFPPQRITQIEAQLEAEKLGGALVVIDDSAENDFVADRVRGPTWLGIGKSAQAWRTLGDAPVTYFAWDQGQPSSFNGEIAASTSPAGFWHDNYASDKLFYAVEWPEQETDATPPTPKTVVTTEAAPSVVGRWQWFVNGEEVPGNEFLPGGEVKSDPTASWRCVDEDQRRYQFVWADRSFIDVLTLSADGRTLRGRNNLGKTVVGRQIEP